jgi:hypothetical protein
VLASGLSPRNRASYGAGLADALLKQGGARQDAITAATDVLSALEDGVTSIRCLNRLRLIRQAAAGTPGAEEFCARFDTIERALVGPRTLTFDGMPNADARVPALPGLPALRRAWPAGRRCPECRASFWRAPRRPSPPA